MVDFIVPPVSPPSLPAGYSRRGPAQDTFKGRILAARRGRRRQRRYAMLRHSGEERRKFREKRRNSMAIDRQDVRIVTIQVTADQDLNMLVGKEVVVRVLG
jgi:hypothetical protein